MTATLKLTRDPSIGIELRRGTFEIFVDGSSAGSIEFHQTVETPVDPGHHTVLVRKGRYSSQRRSFDVADGDVVTFNCSGVRIWPTYVASLIVPNIGISLRRG
jgi:hypothetical protein